LALRGSYVAHYLVDPGAVLTEQDVDRILAVLLPFVQSIPDSLPGSGAFSLAAGIALTRNGKHALAGRYFERASRARYPLSAHSLYMAMVSAKSSREADRLVRLEKELEASQIPGYLRERAKLYSGLALFDLGRDSLARESLIDLLETDPGARGRADVTYTLGRIYERGAFYSEAAKYYARSFESGVSSPAAVDASRAYLSLAAGRKISEEVPQVLSAAKCLARGGYREEARPVLERLYRRAIEKAEVGWELAALYYRMKKFADARRIFVDLERAAGKAVASTRETDSRRALLWMARCERQLSNVSTALRIFREAGFTGRRVVFVEAAWELGLELESLGRLDEAAGIYDLIHTNSTASSLGEEAGWRVGICQYKAGSLTKAHSTFASLLKPGVRTPAQDMNLFWTLKCAAEAGIPASAGEYAAQRSETYSLYSLFLEGIARGEPQDSLRSTSPIGLKGISHDVFTIPWMDLDAKAPASPKPPRIEPGAVTESYLRSPLVAEADLSQNLPLEAERGALLLSFDLRDLAIEELRICERKFKGSDDALFLMAQLYWRNGFYRQAISLADRLTNSGDATNQERGRFLERIRFPVCYPEAVFSESRAQAVDPFLSLSVMKEESTFDPDAISSSGAIGLMQLMPQTAGSISSYLGRGGGGPDLKDPETNIRLGVWHLGRLIGRYSDSIVTALAAYNAGEDNAERWAGSFGAKDGFVYMESVSYRETREYIRKVLADLQAYRDVYRH